MKYNPNTIYVLQDREVQFVRIISENYSLILNGNDESDDDYFGEIGIQMLLSIGYNIIQEWK